MLVRRRVSISEWMWPVSPVHDHCKRLKAIIVSTKVKVGFFSLLAFNASCLV